ncbi:MAG: hypothetical protein ACHQT8_02180 [Chlamydiales bacterium]
MKNIQLLELLRDKDWTVWIHLNGKKVFYGFILLFVLLFAVFHFLGKYLSAGEKIVQNEKASCERALKKVNELSPTFARFAANTLAIHKKEYPQALTEAKELKLKLQTSQEDRASLLYQFNLLRIAFLEMRLGNALSEGESWKELLKEKEEHPKEWALLQSCFQKEDLSLSDFIQSRLITVGAPAS